MDISLKHTKVTVKSKIERIKDLVRIISRCALTETQMKRAMDDVGALIVGERFKEEEFLELKNWIGN